MKKRQGKRHTPEQIIRKLREADTMLAADKTIGQIVQVLETSEQTFHRWTPRSRWPRYIVCGESAPLRESSSPKPKNLRRKDIGCGTRLVCVWM